MRLGNVVRFGSGLVTMQEYVVGSSTVILTSAGRRVGVVSAAPVGSSPSPTHAVPFNPRLTLPVGGGGGAQR